MVAELNYIKLKREVIQVWKKYIENPQDQKNVEQAKKLYTRYSGAASLLPKDMTHPAFALVDIGWKTGIAVNQTKAKEIVKIIEKLEKH